MGGGVQYDGTDMRSQVVVAANARDRELAQEKRMAEFRAKYPGAAATLDARDAAGDQGSYTEMFMYLGGAFLIILAISLSFHLFLGFKHDGSPQVVL